MTEPHACPACPEHRCRWDACGGRIVALPEPDGRGMELSCFLCNRPVVPLEPVSSADVVRLWRDKADWRGEPYPPARRGPKPRMTGTGRPL